MRTAILRPRQPTELDNLSAALRIAFVSGHSRLWRKQRLAAKYFKMRLEGLIYPDVYCLALMLSDKFDFLLEDEKIPRGKYDLVLAELQSSETSTSLPRVAGRRRRPAGGRHSRAAGNSFARPHRPEAAQREAHPERGAIRVGIFSRAQDILRWTHRPRARHRHSVAIRSGGHAEVGATPASATRAPARSWCRFP